MRTSGRVQSFLTGQVLGALFSSLSLLIFVCVLAIYSIRIFLVFVVGSLLYALWISSFLKRRKVLDYELFECKSTNRNRTYQFLTTIQEIKLQNCGQRRRCEWEDAQADLFDVQLNSPVEQLMDFIYSMQDVKISLERINEIHMEENEEHTAPDMTPKIPASSSSMRPQIRLTLRTKAA